MIWFVSTIDAKEQKPQSCISGIFNSFWKGRCCRKIKLYIDIFGSNFYNNERVKNNCRQKQQWLKQVSMSGTYRELPDGERRMENWYWIHSQAAHWTLSKPDEKIVFWRYFESWNRKKVLIISRLRREQPLYCRSIVRYLVRRIVWAVCELRW